MASVEELKKDLEELKKLKDDSTRTRVQNALSVEIHKVESAISLQLQTTEMPSSTPSSGAKPETQIYKEPIKKYAWDQSEKFMKIYVTMNGVQDLPADKIVSEFTKQSVRMVVHGLNNREHELYIARLCEEIEPSQSYHKVKSDCVLLMMRKKATLTWGYVTEAEKKSKEGKKPTVDDKEDPNAGLMKMMQNMYEDGDDEMKKTIAKAWTEGRDKQQMPM